MLNKRISAWRSVAGLSQADLARACGVTASAVTYWEQGETEPTHTHVGRIAEACGVTLATFWGALPSWAEAPVRRRARR